jgi:hypothetical protein
MTEILSRLVTFRQKDENGLLPCQCGGRSLKFVISSQPISQWYVCCRTCEVHLHGYRSEAETISIWNNRLRESALIALVQGAAGEIERLRKILLKLASEEPLDTLYAKDKFFSGAELIERRRFAEQALNPQEAT